MLTICFTVIRIAVSELWEILQARAVHGKQTWDAELIRYSSGIDVAVALSSGIQCSVIASFSLYYMLLYFSEVYGRNM